MSSTQRGVAWALIVASSSLAVIGAVAGRLDIASASLAALILTTAIYRHPWEEDD